MWLIVGWLITGRSELGSRVETEDPSNKLLDVETQLGWLREIGFVDVDCFWKWRELPLLSGIRSWPIHPALVV